MTFTERVTLLFVVFVGDLQLLTTYITHIMKIYFIRLTKKKSYLNLFSLKLKTN